MTFDPIPSTAGTVLDPVRLKDALDLVGEDDRIADVERVDSSRTIAGQVRFSVTVERPDGTGRTCHPCAKGHFRDSPPAFDEAWEAHTLGFTWAYFLWTITRVSSREAVLLHVPRLGAALTDHDTFRRLGAA